ncbi:ABC-type Fe3+-hydroxamate transport system, substrate-binding protein [Nocardioides scoriae]|uniref:ABC-type Fe3+-hydroxamate transport system, substrate-binding protein n=1 Tax=Nocardioides scoriae TaxID=642780 RepID=A0A1H1P9N3_9ACTN|nr:helical backbone metal receptor [Nocardioides scoriae]SDS07922.1 ABC-type Fe3+-hydroxamate transport system, substrate-binding protein [Nocardioides scoriae]
MSTRSVTGTDGSARTAHRVVSLVPSITEALASVRPEALVGATDWCTHPADLDVTRVRGTKNPDLAAVRALRPDVVVANREENRELDVRRLRDAGIRVEVTEIETVPAAVAAYHHLFDDVLGWPRPDWLAEAERLWCGPLPTVTRRVVVPIWRDPWMAVGSRTFTGDLVRRLGLENVLADHPERYPHAELVDLDSAGADVVLLPDEPYPFAPEDGPEAFTRTPTELVSGRLLTWYGPSLLAAHRSLARTPTP